MISPAIAAQVRRIEILTGRLVNESLAGEYHSVFKGRGMEFAQVREYAPGDDVRTIDWNVTARTGRPHVRQYTEERELTVAIAVDLSGSQYFGSQGRLKKEAASELAGVLALAALQNNDKAGLFLFTDKLEAHYPPRKGKRHVLHLIRETLAYRPASKATALAPSLDAIVKVLRRRCILFVISDFRTDENLEQTLSRAALKHDVIPIVLSDEREETIPPAGLIEAEDPETGRMALVDASSGWRWAAAHRRRLDTLLTKLGLDAIRLRANEPVVDPVVRFFRRRARRLRR
jgi:uncharacterized protein (DUF58 family)